jgi:hypothetical protein
MYPDNASLAYKVDHVGVLLPGAQAAFEFCLAQLGLPEAWAFTSDGGTGGVGLGNLNLEWLEWGKAAEPVHQRAAIRLVCFQPAPHSIPLLTDALNRRGVPYDGPRSWGSDAIGFTRVVPHIDIGLEWVFFGPYHYPGLHDNAVRSAELTAVEGGRLGLRGVTELRAAWNRDACAAILGEPDQNRWKFDTGPDLVADTTVPEGTAEMTWSVQDVGAARAALQSMGAQSDDNRTFRVEQLGGLRVRLTDQSPFHAGRLATSRAQLRP